ncbi:MAG: DUF255 domain-containing protein [Planctomyces sp.]|nr:DUF255 domain-containing protein [Planctomyces sp.]
MRIFCALTLLIGLSTSVFASDSDEVSTAPAGKSDVKTNRLALESSPYLLLHAHNPVDWYPWGPEAIEKAKAENKIIFLSIGYSSCYWCHVMEREVFSNPEIAQFMNEHFVNIKVDREERPDLDDIYMTSLLVYQQAVGGNGSGGWPLSMFLTPDGNPVAGATYLPPADTPDGRTGFLTAAGKIVQVWENREETVRESSKVLAAEVRRLSGPDVIGQKVSPKVESVTAAVTAIEGLYDPEFGGVDFRATRPNSPRFPNVPRLRLLLEFSQGTQGTEEQRARALQILKHSLTAMANGGIRDHLGGGFHRYSTDREWHIPHFEKMLYDQAQMLEIYATTALVTEEPYYARVAGEIADFVIREMTRSEGGFCSALDAETNAIEGEYYVWSPKQVAEVLSQAEADRFMSVYSMLETQEFEHGYVLHLAAGDAAKPAVSVEELDALRPLREQLLQKRAERPRPLLDDKVLTEWNGMMIQALAQSSRLPGRSGDLAVAERAAEFLLTTMRSPEGHLMRSWRNNKAVYRGYLDDYAWLVSAMLTIYDVTQKPLWYERAKQLTDEQIELFYDQEVRVFYYTSDEHEELIARSSPVYDSVFPSGVSVTTLNLQRLNAIERASGTATSERIHRYDEIVGSVLERTCSKLVDSPAACAGLALSVRQYVGELALDGEVPEQEDASDEPGESCGGGFDNGDETSEPGTVTTFKPVLNEAGGAVGFLRDENAERPVTAKSFLYFDKLERGGQCPIAIELTIGEEWHINANPRHPEFVVPTELKITSKQKVKLTKVRYPKHELLNVAGSDEPYHVYGGKVIIYGLLEIDGSETAEEAEMEIKLTYQACNENECLPPDQIVLKGKVPVVKTGDPLKKINEVKFRQLTPVGKDKAPAESDEAADPDKTADEGKVKEDKSPGKEKTQE